MAEPTIKDEDTCQALRRDGASKEKAARIANARANPSMHPSKKGGVAKPCEDWSKAQLYDRAQKLNIEGRSRKNKKELIRALRAH